jgi:hypothetical protein
MVESLAGPLSRMLAIVIAVAAPVRATTNDGAEPVAEPAAVSVNSDRITGQFVGVPVDEVLRQIALATGADVVGSPVETRQVTITLDDEPIETALPRILGNQSFSLVFDAEGGLRRVRLINPTAPPVAAGAARVAPPPANGVQTPQQFLALEVPISTVGPLADQFGNAGKASMGQLLEQATASDDAAMRVASIDAAMAAIERDGNLQSSLEKMLTNVDDQILANLVRGAAGQRATEIMSRVLSRTRRPEFRQRVVNVLRTLRES